MSHPELTYGFSVPLSAKADKVEETAGFLMKGYELVQDEPETMQWFAVKYDGLPNSFGIFDTFVTKEGQAFHANGKIADALMANAPELLSGSPQIGSVEIIASKVQKTSAGGETAGLKNGLKVTVQAKPGMIMEIREFLYGALPLVDAEPETLAWYATAVPETDTFGIIDFFPTEEARNAHLNGAVAKALFSKVDEYFVGAPEIVKFDVLAAKIT